MNMNQKSTETKKDIFTDISDNIKKIHESVEHLTPSYTQSLSNLQQEFLTSWKNITSSNISIQQQYANQTGVSIETTEISTQVIHKITEEFIRGLEIQNKLIQTLWDTSRQNIQVIDKNAETITELNKNFINSWIKIRNSKNE